MLFFGTRPRPEAARGSRIVTAAQVGREHAGKTLLHDQAAQALLRQPLPSGLEFAVEDPRRLAELLARGRELDAELHEHGRATTVHPARQTFALLERGRGLGHLRLLDTVGQLLTHTRPGSPAAEQDRYQGYLDTLGRADVLWLVVPSPPTPCLLADEERLRSDVLLTVTYARAALERRGAARPCCVAVVLTRIDARYRDEEEARRRLPREVLGWLRRQVAPLLESDRVGEAALFPVTAFGFGAALPGAARGGNGLARGEVSWRLKPGVAPRPWNLAPLLVWTLWAGLRHKATAALGAAVPELARVCKRLRRDLDELGGWHLPLKG
jgi:hypothetical protein